MIANLSSNTHLVCFSDSSPQSWWKYAISVHVSNIQERNRRLTKSYLSTRAQDVVKYTTTYRAGLLKQSIDAAAKVCILISLMYPYIASYRHLIRNIRSNYTYAKLYFSVFFCLINQLPVTRVLPKGLDTQIFPTVVSKFPQIKHVFPKMKTICTIK